MPKRTHKAKPHAPWAPTAHLIGQELHLLCVKLGQPTPKTFGLCPPIQLYERRPVMLTRHNAGRLLVAVDADKIEYYAHWRDYGLKNITSSVWDDVRVVPEGMSAIDLKLLLWEAAKLNEEFNAHVSAINRARCAAGTLRGKTIALLDARAPACATAAPSDERPPVPPEHWLNNHREV